MIECFFHLEMELDDILFPFSTLVNNKVSSFQGPEHPTF